MQISNAPVGYQTHVRPSQVRDMIRHCEILQATCDRLAHESHRAFLDVEAQPRWDVVEAQWPRRPEVVAFREAAFNNHFVCANWKCFDELQGDAYRSREALLQSRPVVPQDAGFAWLRRFIHSVVIWGDDRSALSLPTLQVASRQGWLAIAVALQRELALADHL